MPKPDTEEAKEEHQIQMIKAKRIIVDSIRDHLIPIVSSKETPKEMYDALSREGLKKKFLQQETSCSCCRRRKTSAEER